jgi:antitoxin component YwqK of YwqJK toxin-antitoxin module
VKWESRYASIGEASYYSSGEIMWIEGTIDAEYRKAYNEDGTLAGEGTLVAGVPQDGFVRLYDEKDNNLISGANYKDGKMDGLARFYYESGQLEREVNYQNDKLTGLARFYNEDGKLAGEGTLIDDVPQDGLIRHYKDNHIISEINYKDGKMQGLAKFYYKNGPSFYGTSLVVEFPERAGLERESNFQNDKMTGLTRYYEENGELAGEGRLIDSVPQAGFIRSYNDSGYITSEVNYKSGKMDGLAKIYRRYKTSDKVFSPFIVEYGAERGGPLSEYIITKELDCTVTYKNDEFVSGSCMIEYQDKNPVCEIRKTADMGEYIASLEAAGDINHAYYSADSEYSCTAVVYHMLISKSVIIP